LRSGIKGLDAGLGLPWGRDEVGGGGEWDRERVWGVGMGTGMDADFGGEEGCGPVGIRGDADSSIDGWVPVERRERMALQVTSQLPLRRAALRLKSR